MAKGRTVDFTVRAKDEFSKVLNDLEKQQAKMSASAKAANRRNLLSVASDEIKAASNSYKQATADIEKYRQAQQNLARTGAGASQASIALGESIAVARQRARESMQALQQNRAALNQLSGASTSGFLAFNRIATVMEKSSTASQAESAAVAQTAAQLNKLTSSSNSAATAQTRLKNQLASTTAAVQKQRVSAGGRGQKGDAQEVEIYGLKPWQMTNLGYQINDVVSGLAMGQRPMQVFAQQAGQIAQIWPNTMVALVRSIPHLLAFSAAAAPFIAAALRMREAAENLKYFQQQLAFSANGGDYNPKQLADMATGFRDIGVSAADARATIMKFANQGMSTSSIKELVTLSQDLSKFTGNSFAEEADRLSKAFSGSGKEIAKLDEELNFLTATQLESVFAMIRNKDAAGAMALAQDALAQKLKDSRSEGSSWSDAAKAMGEAWEALVNLAERTGVIKVLGASWNALGRGAEAAAKGIKAVASIGVMDMDDLNNTIAETKAKLDELKKGGTGDEVMDGLNTDRLQLELDSLLITRREILQTIKDEGLLTAETAASAEARAKAEVRIQEVVAEKLTGLREEMRLLEMNTRERYIEQQVLEARNQALEEANRLGREFLGLTQQQTKEIRDQAGAIYDQQQYNQLTGNSANVVDKIIGIESRGDPNARPKDKNGKLLSTAVGLGQFIEKTWVGMFKKYFPDRAEKMSREAILALRTNADLSRQMVELYVRENAAVLKKAGVATNDAALYLAHFLGPQGAINVLTAKANTPVTELLSRDQINANKSILQGKTAGQVQTWAANKMGVSDPELQAAKTLEELDTKRLKTETDYQKEYAKRIANQQFELTLISKTAKDAAIAKAVRDEELKAKEAGLQLTKEQRAEVERLAAAEFDNKNVNLEVNNLMEQRKNLLESLQLAQAAGDNGKAESVIEQIGEVEKKLQSAIEKAIAFWQAIGGPGADAAIMSLQNMQAGLGKTVTDMQTKFLPTAEQINTQLADIGSNAFSSFAQAIANGENAAQAFFNSLLQGLAEFLIEIGKAIVKQTLFNALTGGQSGSGGIGGGIFSFIGGLFGAKHTGGIIGQAGMTRMVDPSVFAGAAKHHGGGVIGRLASNEVPIIGLRDEEVLTTDDPRHRYNGGGGQAVNVRNVNVIDPRDILQAALETVEGERIFFNFFARNSSKANASLNK